MSSRQRGRLALWLLAGAALGGTACALAQAGAGLQPPARSCPAADEVTHLHLYGLWLARFDGLPGTATLWLEKSPSHAEGVSGSIERADQRALVAGDVDEGDFTLEESSDGQRIAATWIGKVSEDACGMEIQGTWTRAEDNTSYPFVLRKQPGWR
ncbi:hypothetical protein [Ramlibacter sp. 2FC]|uniref:hypothetical protein n=1 Tax=Ramlibacter sp. 2FC TaxID=2502188 RepID=UPI0010F881C7|nr:hypothetical protein [Ramlibacter sp. 2FC]